MLQNPQVVNLPSPTAVSRLNLHCDVTWLENGLLFSCQVVDLLKKLDRRLALIADAHVEKLIGNKLADHWRAQGLTITTLSFPAGESHKTRATKETLEDQLLSKKFGRDSCLIALGGGVATDLVGFLAATYCRGVPFISIPTTLMGMVDACLGGKTGVNTPNGKNMIGAFHPPLTILIDPNTLATLPDHEWKNGMAEVLKYGFIADPTLLDTLEEKPDIEIIRRCLAIKRDVIARDPRETGLRRILNFGHTVGHALEKSTQYRMSHGAAIAIGMWIESLLSVELAALPHAHADKIEQLLSRRGFALQPPDSIPFSTLWEAMSSDKKAQNALPRCVLLETLGNPSPFGGAYCAPIPQSLLQSLWI